MMWMTMMMELREEGIKKKLTDDEQQEVYPSSK
jgi:predicted HTH domain antitoxin